MSTIGRIGIHRLAGAQSMTPPPACDGACRVTLTSPANIRTISQAFAELVSAFDDGGDIELHVSDDEDIDLTLVQLIESARKSADRRGRQFRLASPASGPLLEILERGGFLTGRDDDSRQFWLQERNQ